MKTCAGTVFEPCGLCAACSSGQALPAGRPVFGSYIGRRDAVPAQPARVKETKWVRLGYATGSAVTHELYGAAWEWPAGGADRGLPHFHDEPTIELRHKAGDAGIELGAGDRYEGHHWTLTAADARELAGALEWFAALLEGAVCLELEDEEG